MAINTISVVNLINSVNPDSEYYIIDDRVRGIFIKTTNIGPSNNYQGGIYIKTIHEIWFERVITDGFVDLTWFGLKSGIGFGPINDVAIERCLQACLVAGFRKIRIPAGSYEVTKPIAVPSDFTFQGNSTDSSIIKKVSNNNISTFPIPASPLAPDRNQLIDSQTVDCIFVVYHTDNSYNFRVVLSDFSIQGAAPSQQVEIGIFAPRVGYLNLRNVTIRDCKSGFLTFNCWMSRIENVSVFQSGTPVADLRSGFVFSDDASGLGTGTSVTFWNCYVAYVNVAYSLFGLSYSSFTCCAADHIFGRVYFMNSCRQISLNACGAEDTSLAIPNMQGFVIGLFSSVGITINSFHTFRISGGLNNSNSTVLMVDDGSQVCINSAYFADYLSNQAFSFNILLQSNSRIVSAFLRLPANGLSFASFTSSNWVKLDDISTVLFRNSNTTTTVNFPNLSQQSIDSIDIKYLGTTVFNTSTGQLVSWNGSQWAPLN